MKDMFCRAVPYEGGAPYIFLSYCHKDRERLYPLFEQMVCDRYRVWYDDGNHAGDDWLDTIESHLEKCSAVVAFISGHSSLSHNCKSEIVYALKCKKKVIPVLIENAELPRGLRMQLSYLHYLKADDYPTDAAMLTEIYACEEVKVCRAADGSLQMKEPPGEIVSSHHSIVSNAGNFWSRFHPADRQPALDRGASDQKEQMPENPGDTPDKREAERLEAERREAERREAERREAERREAERREAERREAERREAEQREAERREAERLEAERREAERREAAKRKEAALITPDPDDDEKTIYVRQPVPGEEAADDDDDATVRADCRNLALLLNLTKQCTYLLRKPQAKIGRSLAKCDIVIEDNDSISKYHADIIMHKDKCFLRDANSLNGTFLGGQRLESGSQVQLDNPAVFRLNDERFVLISGALARLCIGKPAISLLIDEECSAVRVMESETLPLNRNNKWAASSSKWPGGILSDKKVHRSAHASLQQSGDDVYLVDQTPEGGNGTFLNGNRLNHAEARALCSGDQIRLGDTVLEFAMITL